MFLQVVGRSEANAAAILIFLAATCSCCITNLMCIPSFCGICKIAYEDGMQDVGVDQLAQTSNRYTAARAWSPRPLRSGR